MKNKDKGAGGDQDVQELVPGIQIREIEAVTPYARNSRTHDDAQVAEIAASIEAFGMVGAIIVRDGIIAKGHGTLGAIQRLYKGGKLIYPAPGKSGGAKPYPPGTVPVMDVSGWSDAQFRAYVIADNRLAEKAGWDNAMLALEFGDLREMDFDLQLTGFDIGEVKTLLGDDETEEPPPKFKEYNEDIETDYCCPKCGYKWSGKSNGGGEGNQEGGEQ